jgi:hypothetical protein
MVMFTSCAGFTHRISFAFENLAANSWSLPHDFSSKSTIGGSLK